MRNCFTSSSEGSKVTGELYGVCELPQLLGRVTVRREVMRKRAHATGVVVQLAWPMRSKLW
jgi:hypothetical protein